MQNLLAAGDDAKIWTGAFFAVVWFVGMIVSALAKQKKERVSRDISASRLPAETPPPREAVIIPPIPPAARRQAKPQRPSKRGKPTPQAFVSRSEVSNVPRRLVAPPAAASTVDDTIVNGRREQFGVAGELRLALRPRNVKMQFVLNELLQPPLALRREAGDDPRV